MLRRSNPWHGNIADWKNARVAAPDAGRPVYEIRLHAVSRKSATRLVYFLRYVPGVDGGPGCVYLPKRGEGGWEENVRIIYREGSQGRWHRAATEWDASIRQAIGR